LMEIGIQPDILICRTEHPLPDELRRKIALFCNVETQAVIEARDVDTIYEVPLRFHEQKLDDLLVDRLGLETPDPDLSEWAAMVERIRRPSKGGVRIVMVGKYTQLVDAYKSVNEALVHGGIANDVGVDIEWVGSEEFEKGRGFDRLDAADGVLVPGGFGVRGVEGMVEAIRHVREGGIPFLGLCLGLQVGIIEFARDVCKLAGSNSREFQPECSEPVISLLDSQRQVTDMGGSMRLGAYPCRLRPGSLAEQVYGVSEVSERHRHRYEVNNAYRDILAQHGMRFSGVSPDQLLVEILELPDHPWFLATQFHPELKSRPTRPHPIFAGFIGAALKRRTAREEPVRLAAREQAVGVRGDPGE
ncbi:MAG: CTP synthase, partial [Gemmatimonadetes bacterium]|nr:CTP synthase [Gemmatimonadota bacterium]